jgi:hypothetical protein
MRIIIIAVIQLLLVATISTRASAGTKSKAQKYLYKGETVYFTPAQYPDGYGELKDAKGKYLCAPDGGKSGKGDGKCSDFFELRKEAK